jgi:predicted phage terminase large subunit-like protein
VATLDTVAAIQWQLNPARMGAYLSGRPGAPVEDDPEWEQERSSTSLAMYPHTALLGRKFMEAATGKSKRQIWAIGPRYGKTLVGSNWGPVWFLNLWPNKRVILGSYGQDLALRNGRAVRNLLREHRDELSVNLSSDSQAADRFNTEQGGGLLAAGVGSAMTGFGADLMVIDDPFKDWKEAQSLVQRENVWEWYRSVARTRIQRGGSIIIIATRWHKDDLSGRLIADDRRRVLEGKRPQWEVIRLPTIADSEARMALNPEEKPDLLGRKDGEPLCEFLFPLDEVLDQREDLGSANWRAMHQQDPTDADGSIFRREWWRWYEARPDPMHIHQWTMSVDAAFKERHDSSFVVMQVWARVGADHFLMDQVRGRWDYPRTKSELQRLHKLWPWVTRILVEDKANGPAIIADLGRTIPGMIPVQPVGSKESRAQAVASIPESGHCILPAPGLCPWIVDFVEECSDFPDGVADDQVDSLSQYLVNIGGMMGAVRKKYGRANARR